jgi:hypothetical protein
MISHLNTEDIAVGIIHDILDWNDPDTILKVWKFLNDSRDSAFVRN